MPKFVLTHTHNADECAVSVAAWRGFASPLRHGTPLGSCALGGHCVWWTVDASDEVAALALLPDYVARRTVAAQVREVHLP